MGMRDSSLFYKGNSDTLGRETNRCLSIFSFHSKMPHVRIPLLIPTMKYKIPVEKGGFFFLSVVPISSGLASKNALQQNMPFKAYLPISYVDRVATVSNPSQICKNQKPPFRGLFRFLLVGNEGFEPPMPESESGALPLG